jgi:hypothetical protein
MQQPITFTAVTSQEPVFPTPEAAFKAFIIAAYCERNADPEIVASAFEILPELRRA